MRTGWFGCAGRTAAEAGPTPRYDRKDSAYRRAKREGFRSRAVYKLDDLIERAGGLPAGSAVVELGCWPGGWLQRLAALVGARGRVVGVDLREVEEIGPPVVLQQLDFTEPHAAPSIRAALGRAADAVLSDAAPKLTGIRDVDRAACEELYDAALSVALHVLRPGGLLVLKGFPGPEAQRFRGELRACFASVREVRPEGKRATSKEFYWIARGLEAAAQHAAADSESDAPSDPESDRSVRLDAE